MLGVGCGMRQRGGTGRRALILALVAAGFWLLASGTATSSSGFNWMADPGHADRLLGALAVSSTPTINRCLARWPAEASRHH